MTCSYTVSSSIVLRKSSIAFRLRSSSNENGAVDGDRHQSGIFEKTPRSFCCKSLSSRLRDTSIFEHWRIVRGVLRQSSLAYYIE